MKPGDLHPDLGLIISIEGDRGTALKGDKVVKIICVLKSRGGMWVVEGTIFNENPFLMIAKKR